MGGSENGHLDGAEEALFGHGGVGHFRNLPMQAFEVGAALSNIAQRGPGAPRVKISRPSVHF